MDDGKLRHYIFEGKQQTKMTVSDEVDENDEQNDTLYHDYQQGQYCYERVRKLSIS